VELKTDTVQAETVIVPSEPTDDMWLAATRVAPPDLKSWELREVWSAMLSAAPAVSLGGTNEETFPRRLTIKPERVELFGALQPQEADSVPTEGPGAAVVGLQDGRDMSGETVMGMRVAGWRWKTEIPLEVRGSAWAYSYASHYSTGPEDAERLFTESDVRALLASQAPSGEGGSEEVSVSRRQMAEWADRIDAATDQSNDGASYAVCIEMRAALSQDEKK
jgi:hypothetical protein